MHITFQPLLTSMTSQQFWEILTYAPANQQISGETWVCRLFVTSTISQSYKKYSFVRLFFCSFILLGVSIFSPLFIYLLFPECHLWKTRVLYNMALMAASVRSVRLGSGKNLGNSCTDMSKSAENYKKADRQMQVTIIPPLALLIRAHLMEAEWHIEAYMSLNP